MRNMSFAATIEQVKARTKDVTRRTGWLMLKPGDRLNAVEKAMGLKRGEKLKKLGTIEVLSVTRQQLVFLAENPRYGQDECRREGFPEMTPAEFVAMFCDKIKVKPFDWVTRIEFRYVE